MARPGTAGGETAERILEAALTCFSESGYSGTSTRTLAAAAGVNVATLAYHFKGKEGLYQAAIDQLYQRFLTSLPEKVDFSALAEATPAERVAFAVRFAYRFSLENRRGVRLLLRHLLEHGHLPDQVREGWIQQLLERAEMAWALLGLPPDPHWRLKLLSVNHLIARYAITEGADFAPFMDAADPHAAVEDHLVELAQRLLGVA